MEIEKKGDDPRKKIGISINVSPEKEISKTILPEERISLEKKDSKEIPFSPLKKAPKNDKEKSEWFS